MVGEPLLVRRSSLVARRSAVPGQAAQGEVAGRGDREEERRQDEEERAAAVADIDKIDPQACRRHVETAFNPRTIAEQYVTTYRLAMAGRSDERRATSDE